MAFPDNGILPEYSDVYFDCKILNIKPEKNKPGIHSSSLITNVIVESFNWSFHF
jgi:hypothetical protein